MISKEDLFDNGSTSYYEGRTPEAAAKIRMVLDDNNVDYTMKVQKANEEVSLRFYVKGKADMYWLQGKAQQLTLYIESGDSPGLREQYEQEVRNQTETNFRS